MYNKPFLKEDKRDKVSLIIVSFMNLIGLIF